MGRKRKGCPGEIPGSLLGMEAAAIDFRQAKKTSIRRKSGAARKDCTW
jgi:hypothetical protein